MSTPYDNKYKNVGTFVTMNDFAMLQHLAFKSKVTVAAYIRAIIVDAVQDQLCIENTIKSTPTNTNHDSV